MGQQRPGHAHHLVGERHRHDLEGSPRQELRELGIPRSEYGYAPEIGDRSTWFAHGQGGLLNMGSVCACLDASGHFIQLVVPQLSVSASKLRSVVCLAHDLSLHNGAATAQDRATCSGATNPSGPPFTVTLGAGGGIGMLGVPPAI